MKRGLIFLLLLFVSIILIFPFIVPESTGKAITGEGVSGEATAQQMDMSITIMGISPILTLISPKNNTYITNISILLNYSASNNPQAVWYMLDNEANVTITSSIYLNLSQGSHSIYLYSNNSYGLTTKNVSFSIDNAKFKIYNNKTINRGETTNFLSYSYEEMQNLSNIILDNQTYGKIKFNDAINLTDSENYSDNLLDLDNYIDISYNRIELNSVILKNFNKNATLWIYGLSFTNPRILKDGSVCSSSICKIENYSGGILKFNVTGFSVYTSEETPATPSETPAVTPSGGGGGGIIAKEKPKNISLDKDVLKIKVKQGETKLEELNIKNEYNKKIALSLKISGVNDFVKLSEEKIDIEAGETHTIFFDFIARENTIPNLYLGKLIIKGDKIEKEILVIVEVESKKPLFDVKLTIPSRFKIIKPGDDLISTIELKNLGGMERVDVKLEYFIINENNETITHQEESIAVETSASLVKTFKMPENLAYGKYILYVKLTYNENVASASDVFSLGEARIMDFERITIIIILIIILFAVYELIILKKYKGQKKIDENIFIQHNIIKKKR